MLIYINTFLWFLLLISLIVGITRNMDKKIVKAMIYSRILYLVLIIAIVALSINYFTMHPYIIVINFILTVVAISFVDICYQRKIQGNLKAYIIVLALLSILASISMLYLLK